ncbi:MAG: hydantoinase B/oxoprolinase family protein [Candidatus Hodarchaeales archaeon]
MTNTMNTPVEASELSYPMRIRKYSFRNNSGGAGKHRGSDGFFAWIARTKRRFY